MLKYQDIRISDVNKRYEFIADVEVGNYTTAHAIVTADAMSPKALIAVNINHVASEIEATENLNDATFKADRIQVATEAPTLQSGQVYFELTG